jgi:hypothetical protein
MSDTTPAPNGAHKKKAGGKSVSAALILVLAIVAFAAAFTYVGGVDYVAGLFGGGPAAPGAGTPGTGTPATGTGTAAGDKRPTDVPDALAERMYIEQIESAPRIERLAAGETTEFTIEKVQDKSPTEKWVVITAHFSTDPKTIQGVMCFSKAGANWYFLWIQDLTGAATTAEGLLTTPKLTEPSEPTAEEYEEAGVKTIDRAVIDTILSSQAANQAFVGGILDGTYTSVAVGKPAPGQQTITIPVTATGPSADMKGSITLVIKEIDGKPRTFVASFKKL